MRLRLAIEIAALSAGLVLAVSGPVVAQGDPCSGCGPGPHWVDNCAAKPDTIADNGAAVGIDFDLDCVEDQSFLLCSCIYQELVIDRSDPLDDSYNYPGLRPLDDHNDVIDTEIIQMCLKGGGITLVAGAGEGLGGSLLPSVGAIAELPEDSERAESFFDVYFEIDLGGGMYVYNHDPLRLETEIHCVPPEAATYMHVQDCVPLWTDPDSGMHVANLVRAEHSVNCGYPSATRPATWGGVKSLYK